MTQDLKTQQELACARAFVDWLSSRDGIAYDLERAADSPLRGRWDFIAREQGGQRWLALEIKSLVLSEDRRQFNSWESFLTRVSKEMPGRVEASYFVMAAIPWQFRQQQARELIGPFIEALAELDIEVGQQGNLGPGIAARFAGWPTKPPAHDENLWREHRVWKVVHPTEDLFVIKDSDQGSSIELGISVGQAHDVDWTLKEALLDIFEPDKKGQVKPNIQLEEADGKGAGDTVLLLDSYMPWRPEVVRVALQGIHAPTFSSIGGVYLVSTAYRKVERVRP